jgi:hypothetical protein
MNEVKRTRKQWFVAFNFIFDEKISNHAKLLYCFMCRIADNEGFSFPSHKYIADKCGIGVTSIKKAIKELEEIGVLDVAPRVNKTKGKTSNLYSVIDKIK